MKLGELGEKIAANYLESKGYSIIEKNFRCRYGEIDIITYFENKIIFVEVKSRNNDKYGLPREAVNKKKINHISLTIKHYIQKYNIEDIDKQIDVIEIINTNNNYLINHIENAVY